jgi:bacteriorhodopsin
MAHLWRRIDTDDLLKNNIVNGKAVDIAITELGSNVCFGVCAVLSTMGLGLLAASFAKPCSHRLYFYLTAAINIMVGAS